MSNINIKNDISIIRKTAVQYVKMLETVDNKTAYSLQKAVNDKKMVRPVVLIDELPWHELNFNGELNLYCEDPFLKSVEKHLKQNIFQAKYFPADKVFLPYIPVDKVINLAGYGMDIEETVIHQDGGNNVKSHEYIDQLKTFEDVKKLHKNTVTYNEAETMRRFNMLGSIIGDILPLKLKGINFASMATWDKISELRGVTPLLMGLIDEPELMHAITAKLTEVFWDMILQYEKLELFDSEPHTIHCTSAASDDLPAPIDGSPRKIKDIWGRGVAQIFASVGNDMHEEFDIEYMKNTVGKCGLVYYGCCEPLDKKIDIVEKIPNLRKISITPWADINVAAEAINKKYVIASKPNPSALAVNSLDEDGLRQEITGILNACKQNNCNVELTLKDISTCNKKPENIFKWHNIVCEIVRGW